MQAIVDDYKGHLDKLLKLPTSAACMRVELQSRYVLLVSYACMRAFRWRVCVLTLGTRKHVCSDRLNSIPHALTYSTTVACFCRRGAHTATCTWQLASSTVCCWTTG